MLKKKIWASFQRITDFLPKTLSLSSQKYGFVIRDPRSGIHKKPIPDPRSGSRGQKGTGFRIWIRNTVEEVECTAERLHLPRCSYIALYTSCTVAVHSATYVGRVHCRGSVHLLWWAGCLRLRLPLPHIPRLWKGESGRGHYFPPAYLVSEVSWSRPLFPCFHDPKSEVRSPLLFSLATTVTEQVTDTLFPCFHGFGQKARWEVHTFAVFWGFRHVSPQAKRPLPVL